MNLNDSIKNLIEKNEQQKASLVESVDENNMFEEMLKKYSSEELEKIPLNVTKQGMKSAKNKFKDKIINNLKFNSTAALNAIKNLTEKNEQQKASLVESVDENILTK